MDAEHADLLERAELLQKAMAIQGKAREGASEPKDGSEPFDITNPVMGALGAGAKVLDLPRAAVGAPLLGKALELLTGKEVFKGSDYANAWNPTNLSTFPTSSEMLEKAGLDKGGSLSDILPYADPNKSHPWYQPEKGGMLDFTGRGAAGTALDEGMNPLNYISLGEAGALKKTLRQSASRRALDPEIMNMSKAEKAASKIAMELPDGKVRSVLGTAASFPSKISRWFGERSYNSTLLPVEHEAEKYGKEAVGQTMYNAGIASPHNLNDKAEKAAETLLKPVNQMMEKSAEMGGRVDFTTDMRIARENIEKLRGIKSPSAHDLADVLEEKVKEMEKISSGVADKVEVIPGQITYNEQFPYGTPATKVIPGKAPSPYTASEMAKVKTFESNDIPARAYKDNMNLNNVTAGMKKVTSARKEAVENVVSRTLGPEAADNLRELNAEAGKLLSTRTSQGAVSRQADRLNHSLTSPTGSHSMIGSLALAATNSESSPLKALAAKLAIDAARYGTMPAGYGLRRLGEGALSGPILDAASRKLIIKKLGQPSEDERRKKYEEDQGL